MTKHAKIRVPVVVHRNDNFEGNYMLKIVAYKNGSVQINNSSYVNTINILENKIRAWKKS